MTLNLTDELRAAVAARAEQRKMTPEEYVLDLLRWQVLPEPITPRSEAERRLFALGTDCGVVVPNEALSSEGLYE